MRKLPKPWLYLTVLTTLFAGSVLAQQAPAPSTPPAATQQAPASTTPKTPAAKPKTSTTQKPAPAPLTLKTQKEKFSYALGMNLGTGLKKQEVEVDPTILARGFRDAFGGGKTALTEDEARTVLMAAQAELRKKQQEKQQAESATNKKAGEEFLAANKAKDGVITLPSGLQYKVLTEGTGPKPAATDSVLCNYKGTLIDGTEFDSSYKRGQPATIPVSGVIKAWTEALQMMPVGSKWELFVPAELGYGERQAGPQIGPNSTLIFEVELLSIQPKEAPKAAPVAPGDLKDDKAPPPGTAPTPKP
jgi:FKBP-type peptidyl-prolyl cis-trans isomerase FklB